MDLDLIQASQSLARGHTLRVPDNPGGSVLVVRGRVWLTRKADPMDYVLGAGESVLLDHRTDIIATALEDSAIAVLSAGAAAGTSVEVGTDIHTIDAYRQHAEVLRSQYLARCIAKLADRVTNALCALGKALRTMITRTSRS